MSGDRHETAAVSEGERWTRDQLHRVWTQRYAPGAVARFLRASSRRSAAVRRQQPALARRAHRWSAVGALIWLTLAAAGAQPFRRRLRAGIASWIGTALMLDWHLGMVETEDGRARNLGVADALTLTRAWLIPVAFDTPAPIVIALAAATDALDGPLARRTGPTRAGRDLEALVDACFAAAALRGALRHGWLPQAVAGAELLRLAVGVGCATVVYLGRACPPRPELLRAARGTTAIRAGGLVLAGTAHRRAAAALIAVGSAASVALVATAWTAARHGTRTLAGNGVDDEDRDG